MGPSGRTSRGEGSVRGVGQMKPLSKHWRTGKRTRKGVDYFPSFESARSYAQANHFPTDRIISYEVGWAIQLYVSGPYVGPQTFYKKERTT